MIQMVQGKDAFDAALAKGDMVAGFSAPWCGYCRRLRPLMEKMSEEIDIPVYGVNVDEDKELAARYDVETIPDLIYFHDGKPVDHIIGYGNVGYPELMAFVEKNKK